MPDFILGSLRGGMNNTDPAIALPDDQAVLHENTELVNSMLGERRLGTDAITLPAFLSGKDKVPFLYRHLPTADATESELIALGVTGTSTAALGRKTSTWQAEVTIPDTPTLTGLFPYRWQAQTLHGKLFLAYKSASDRLHVWDGDDLRRTGLAQPAAPTGADGGGAGSLTGRRHYRVRYTEQVSGATVRRSEPSDTYTHDPGGSNAAVVVTKPTAISEGETHWELEASVDGTNFYRLATTAIATPTVNDSTAFAVGYSDVGPLSEDIGDYALIPSARYLTADEDRLIWAGSYEDADLGSRVGWTPVFGAEGVGNDERFETDTDPFKDLDTYEGGVITGLSAPTLGAVWVFKQSGIYKLVRTGRRNRAYDVIKYTDALGAVHGSVVSGFTATGQPCVYFIDQVQGPCRVGMGGIVRCGEDIRRTWETLNPDATAVACAALYYPTKRQVRWTIAIDSNNTPTRGLILHVDKTRETDDGVRKGWALWTGTITKALSMCLYADNIESNAARSLNLVPFIGLEGLGLVHQCETGDDDNGVAYAATVRSKPQPMPSILHQFEVKSAALVAKAHATATVSVRVIRDFGLETSAEAMNVTLAAEGDETDVIRTLDSLTSAELRVAQFEITDGSTVGAWQINQLAVRETEGQQA